MIHPIECLGWGWWGVCMYDSSNRVFGVGLVGGGGVCMYDSSNRVFGVGLVGRCACMILPIECLGWGWWGVCMYDSSNRVFGVGLVGGVHV